MFIVFFRTVLLYFAIILSLRLMGKRQIGELSPGELVVTILVSNLAALPIAEPTLPMLSSIAPMLTLVALEILMSAIGLKFKGFRDAVGGHPMIVVRGGVADKEMLKKLRMSFDDLNEALREQQIFDVSTVELAIVETTGKVSIMQKDGQK
jgi:Predicted membrane protein